MDAQSARSGPSKRGSVTRERAMAWAGSQLSVPLTRGSEEPRRFRGSFVELLTRGLEASAAGGITHCGTSSPRLRLGGGAGEVGPGFFGTISTRVLWTRCQEQFVLFSITRTDGAGSPGRPPVFPQRRSQGQGRPVCKGTCVHPPLWRVSELIVCSCWIPRWAPDWLSWTLFVHWFS